MQQRAERTAKIIELFRQYNSLTLTDISMSLSFTPETVKELCDDLVKSGILRDTGWDEINPVYVATEKISEDSIYHLLIDDNVPENMDDFVCVMRISVFVSKQTMECRVKVQNLLENGAVTGREKVQ